MKGSTFFDISLSEKDYALLKQIKIYFGVGSISFYEKTKSCKFRVSSIKDINLIINNFRNFPLITQKRANFLIFQEIFNIIQRGEHLTKEGLYKIITLKASMNLGLTEKLQSEFKNIKPVERPLVVDENIQDPHWLAGFTSAEGCFLIAIQHGKTLTGYTVNLVFKLAQHSRDEQLLKSFIKYLVPSPPGPPPRMKL